jgi:hypothetical protein
VGEGAEAKVDGFGDFGLGELAFDVRIDGALDDWMDVSNGREDVVAMNGMG